MNRAGPGAPRGAKGGRAHRRSAPPFIATIIATIHRHRSSPPFRVTFTSPTHTHTQENAEAKVFAAPDPRSSSNRVAKAPRTFSRLAQARRPLR
jgi:hypothetical protein